MYIYSQSRLTACPWGKPKRLLHASSPESESLAELPEDKKEIEQTYETLLGQINALSNGLARLGESSGAGTDTAAIRQQLTSLLETCQKNLTDSKTETHQLTSALHRERCDHLQSRGAALRNELQQLHAELNVTENAHTEFEEGQQKLFQALETRKVELEAAKRRDEAFQASIGEEASKDRLKSFRRKTEAETDKSLKKTESSSDIWKEMLSRSRRQNTTDLEENVYHSTRRLLEFLAQVDSFQSRAPVISKEMISAPEPWINSMTTTARTKLLSEISILKDKIKSKDREIGSLEEQLVDLEKGVPRSSSSQLLHKEAIATVLQAVQSALSRNQIFGIEEILEKCTDLRTTLDRLRIASLERQARERRNHQAQVDDIVAQTKEIVASTKSKGAKLIHTQVQAARSSQGDLAKALAEIERLGLSLADLEEKMGQRALRNEALEAMNRALREVQIELKQRLADKGRYITQLRREIEGLKESSLVQTGKLAALELEIRRLQSLDEEHQAAVRRIATLSAELLQKNELLEQQVARTDTQEQMHQRFRNALGQIKEDLDRANRILSEQAQAQEYLQQQLSDTETVTEEKVRELELAREINDNLNAQLAAQKKENGSLRSQLASTKEQQTELETALMKAAADKAELEVEKKALKERLSAIEEELSAAQTAKEAQDQDHAQSRAVDQEHLEKLNEGQAELQAEGLLLAGQFNDVKRDSDKIAAENEDKSRRIATLEEELRDALHQKDETLEKNQELKGELNASREKSSEIEGEVAFLSAERDRMLKKLRMSASSLGDSSRVHTELFERLKEKIESPAESSVSSESTEDVGIDDLVSFFEGKIARLKTQNEKLIHELERTKPTVLEKIFNIIKLSKSLELTGAMFIQLMQNALSKEMYLKVIAEVKRHHHCNGEFQIEFTLGSYEPPSSQKAILAIEEALNSKKRDLSFNNKIKDPLSDIERKLNFLAYIKSKNIYGLDLWRFVNDNLAPEESKDLIQAINRVFNINDGMTWLWFRNLGPKALDKIINCLVFPNCRLRVFLGEAC